MSLRQKHEEEKRYEYIPPEALHNFLGINFITNKVKLFTNRSGQLAKGIDINLAI